MAADGAVDVYLHVYDLSSGLATQLSKALLGKQVDGVWHTGVVYRNIEYFYGAGVHQSAPGATPFGHPLRVVKLGKTQVPPDVFEEYMADMRLTWTPEAYSLFENNCNHFSDEVTNFLTGANIPAYISDLPKDVLSTPFGQMIAPGLRNVQGRLNSVAPVGGPVPQTPFSPPQTGDVTASIAEALRAATAAVVADTGMPLDADSTRKLAPQHADDSIKSLAAANASLAINPHAAAEMAAGLGRGSIGREHREQLEPAVASTMGFPAPVSRRLTTAQSGEIITRLGSGQLLPSSAGRSRPEAPRSAGEHRRLLPTPRDGPKEPKDGTRAQPGPSSAKIAGLNAGVAHTLDRSNSGRTAAAKAQFECIVRKEFAKIMAEGGYSPNEAAAQAIRRAAAVSPSAA